MEEFCYKIPYCKEVKKAIDFALNENSNIFDKELLEEWKENRINLPISILDKTCKLNEKNPNIPVKYQFTWFCLHNVKVFRKQLGGKIISPIVKFAPIYIEKRKNLLHFLRKAIKILRSKEKFCGLIGYSRTSLNGWLNLKSVRKPPITAFIKACQLLNIDLWDVLDGVKLYGKTSKNFIVFKKNISSEIDDLRIWIFTEGTLQINRELLQIRQNEDGINALHKIAEILTKNFEINLKSLKIVEDQKHQLKLIVQSPSLRQIFYLRYGIPLGYKVYSEPSKDLFTFTNREEGIKKLTRFLETEGCFSFYNKKDHYNMTISFGCRNESMRDNFFILLSKLGYKPKKYQNNENNGAITYSVGLFGFRQLTKICYEILPYMWHYGKLLSCFRIGDKQILLDPNFLCRLRLNLDSKIQSLICESIKCSGDVEKLANYLRMVSEEFDISISEGLIYHWYRGTSKIPIFVILKMCELMKEDYLEFLPDYVSILLWINNLSKRYEIEKIRGLSFDNVSNALNNQGVIRFTS